MIAALPVSFVAKGVRLWDERLRQHWHEVHWGGLFVSEEKGGWTFEVQLYLGEVSPDSIQVQLYADPVEIDAPVCEIMQRHTSIPGALNGYIYRYSMSTARPYTDFIPRIVAYHSDAHTPVENNLILWWSGVAELQRN